MYLKNTKIKTPIIIIEKIKFPGDSVIFCQLSTNFLPHFNRDAAVKTANKNTKSGASVFSILVTGPRKSNIS